MEERDKYKYKIPHYMAKQTGMAFTVLYPITFQPGSRFQDENERKPKIPRRF